MRQVIVSHLIFLEVADICVILSSSSFIVILLLIHFLEKSFIYATVTFETPNYLVLHKSVSQEYSIHIYFNLGMPKGYLQVYLLELQRSPWVIHDYETI